MMRLLTDIRAIRRRYYTEFSVLHGVSSIWDDVHAVCGAAFVTIGTIASAIGLLLTLGVNHG